MRLASRNEALARKICLAVILAATAFVYVGIAKIPFLYSEVTGISANPAIQSFSAFWVRFSSLNGLLHRPLSVLSFTLDHAMAGNSPKFFHWVNLLIHLLNSGLVYWVALRFFRAPLVAAAVFALHPLGTACVSQVFGRPYSLGTGFLLASLGIFLAARQRGSFSTPIRFALAALIFLAVLSKQGLIIFPAIFLLHFLCFPPEGVRADACGSRLLAGGAALTALGVCALAGAAIVFYAVPLSKTAPVGPGVYFLSQLGSVPAMLAFYFLPFQTALVHDLPFSRSLFSLPVLVGLVFLVASFTAVWRFRGKRWAFLLGALFICLVPTQTFFPKNEIIREWRLYPSLVFFALLMGEVMGEAATALQLRTSSPLRKPLVGLFVCYLAVSGLSIWRQNRAYQSMRSAWEQVLAHYPHSADAFNNIGVARYQEKDYDGAAQFMRQAMQEAPKTSIYYRNLAAVYSIQGNTAEATRLRDEGFRVAAENGERQLTITFRD